MLEVSLEHEYMEGKLAQWSAQLLLAPKGALEALMSSVRLSVCPSPLCSKALKNPKSLSRVSQELLVSQS